jgi:very-short-patch-repair endonuclease
MHEIPEALRDGPFTSRTAAKHGVSWKALQGRRYVRLFTDVYVSAGAATGLLVLVRAALLRLPPDAVVSGVTAARLWGFQPRGHQELHFSTCLDTRTRLPVRLHRHVLPVEHVRRDGVAVTTAARTVVDCARELGFVQLVQLIDHLVHVGATTRDRLHGYCWGRPYHGVVRARRALLLAADGAESPRETVLRLMIVLARLPAPRTNLDVRDAAGRFVARVDLLLEAWGVVVEYDGRHHETDSRQWYRSRRRREAVEALGLRVIVVSSLDLDDPEAVVRRIHRALVERGYDGAPPHLNVMWHRWFPARPGA